MRRYFFRVINAIINQPDLQITLPCLFTAEGQKELLTFERNFQERSSSQGLMRGCVGAIDGYFVKTDQPCGIADPVAYYSSHYESFGMNVQAVCNSRLEFIYFSVAAPGRCNDIIASQRCVDLQRRIDNLGNCFLVGDNAYDLRDQLLIPFSGSQKNHPTRQIYNYFLSQLRVRIEQAFGLLTTKFRIFRKSFQFHMATVSKVICACFILHNYIIKQQGTSDEWYDAMPGEPNGLGYWPSLETAEERQEYEQQNLQDIREYGESFRRDRMLDQIVQQGLRKPHLKRANPIFSN
jgi:hypothetical protein